MNSYEIKSLLQRAPEYRPKLYARGFLVTDADVKKDEHPFYGLWREWRSSKFSVLCAPGEQACFIEQPSISICLIGHAYNPFTGDIEEKEIVKKLADASADMEGAFSPFLIS